MRVLNIFFVLLLLMGVGNIQAQQFNQKQVQLIDGKTYYLHKVEQGNTIYSLSVMYSIKIKDLIQENPQLEEGLKIGQVIRIPVRKIDSKAEGGNHPTIEGEFLIHEVLPKETQYGISKRYAVSIDALKAINPELSNGLKIGMKLKIPQPQVPTKGVDELALAPAEEDSFLLHFVEPQETLYSLAIEYDVNIDSIRLVNGGLKDGLKVGTTIRIPIQESTPVQTDLSMQLLNTDSLPEMPVLLDSGELKERYVISLLIPFYLDTNDSINVNKLAFEKPQIYNQSKIGLNFYCGFKSAFDQYENDSVSFEIKAYDIALDRYTKSNADMTSLTNDEEFFRSDLIVGPFHRSNFIVASEYAKKSQTPIVSPVPQRNDILDNNPYAVKVHSSKEAQVDYMRDYTVNEWKDKNVVLVENNELQDVVLVERFQGIINGDTNQVLYDSINQLVKKVKFYEFDTAKLNRVLDDSLENIILMPMGSKTFIGRFLTGLNKLSTSYNLKVVGLDSWNNMGYLEYRYLNNLKVHTVHNQFVDYQDSTVESFILAYREEFSAEPNNWAFLGYDMANYFIQAMTENGTGFLTYFNNEKSVGLSKNFRFERNSSLGGFENKSLRMVKIENYQYHLLNANGSQ